MANSSWLIVGTIPDESLPILFGQVSWKDGIVRVGENALPLGRGTAALLAAQASACSALGCEAPYAWLVGDTGSGKKSRMLYANIVEESERLGFQGITFHYAYPDVDWHNRILLALERVDPRPMLVADAGFMYVAKMSGYAASYDLFTPDLGELAYLADPLAPHPFYTRGFLFAEACDLTKLVDRAYQDSNAASWLIVKGKVDHIVHKGTVVATISEPNVPAMEAIGGTGDLVTGLVSAHLAFGLPMREACVRACTCARTMGTLANTSPASQIGDLLPHLPEALACWDEPAAK
ncbi:MAG: sugar kinase [Desulfovibrionaceae bacterium]|nr:sugar kinase [Desulfovibrionaceae bacterium]